MNDNLPVQPGNSSILKKKGGGPCCCFNNITIHYLLRFYEEQYVQIVNPFKPNGISHYYHLDWSISVLRVVRYFTLLFKFLFNFL